MEAFLVIYIISVVIGLVILYFLMMYAVKAGNKKTLFALRLLINLKAIEMRRAGFTDSEIKEALNSVRRVDELNKALINEEITREQYELQTKEFLI